MTFLQKTLFCFVFFCFCLSFHDETKAQGDHKTVLNIAISGNRITKDRIILRECTLLPGDSLPSSTLPAEVKQTRVNLLNTRLFNFVEVKAKDTLNNAVTIQIEVAERWYIWPAPIFELAETNFNTWWKTKDFSRTNYGFFVNHDNFRGRKEKLNVKFRFGYRHEYRLSYFVPYVNEKQNLGLGISFSYFENDEIVYGTQANERLFFQDDEVARREYFGKFQATYRSGFYDTHFGEIRYVKSRVKDSVTTIAQDYFQEGKSSIEYLGLLYEFRWDRRDFQPYPLHGHYLSVNFLKRGFGLINQDGLNLLHTIATYRKYVQLGKRTFWAASARGKLSLYNDYPYYLQEGFGYGEFVRGYEFYVVDGQHYGLLRTNLKWELVKPRVGAVNFVNIPQFNKFYYAFYVNLLADIGYVWDEFYDTPNFLDNTLLRGIGLGLDFVTYYDKVIRLEYSINHLGEHGMFVHFRQPI